MKEPYNASMGYNFNITNHNPDYYIVIGSLSIGVQGKYPNWFNRKMMTLVFGWEFEKKLRY